MFSSIAFWIVVSSSPRSHGSSDTLAPATRRSRPIFGAVGIETSSAPYPGAAVVRLATTRRRAPAKPKLAAVIGTRAPTAVVTTSISAVASLCQSSSTSNAIASAPRSYARALISRGAVSPTSNLRSSIRRTRPSTFTSRSAPPSASPSSSP